MLPPMMSLFADQIARHDWSDAPYRTDRAGHQREDDFPSGRQSDTILDASETERALLNVFWVVAKGFLESGYVFNPHEFAIACGIKPRPFVYNSNGEPSGWITQGLTPGVAVVNGLAFMVT